MRPVPSVHDTGMFEKTDKCCREHDHCKNTIPAFRVNYGVFNSNLFTVSHCDCDQRFRQCLMEVNDPISNMVGYSFFNVLKVPCFEFTQKKHCTQISWWGLCKAVQLAPYAVFKNPTAYNSTDPDPAAPTGTQTITLVTSSPAASTINSRKAASTTTGKQTVISVTSSPFASTIKSRKAATTTGKQTVVLVTSSPSASTIKHRKAVSTTAEKQTAVSITSSPSTSTVTRRKAVSTTTGKHTVVSVTSSPTSTTLSSITPAARTCQSWDNRPKPSKHPKGRRRCSQRGPSRGDTFWPSRRRGGGSGHSKGRKARVKLTTASPAPTTSTSTVTPVRKTTSLSTGKNRSSPSLIKQRKQLLSENALPTALPWDPKMHAPNNLPAPVQDTRYKDKLQLCDCYKQLDECKYKILPLEERYGLRNLESKILYHCNCARRLARQLRQLKEPSAVQSLLLDFVSLSCFKMPRIEDCPRRRRCAAVVSESPHLQRALKEMEVTEAIRGHVGSTPKVKRQNTKTAFAKSPPVRLYKRCLRITRPKSPEKDKPGILGARLS
ncbi:hypothetical protein MATL_G00062170 [Megalops atlanticus]|uniref:Phospholipase A2-like central domain-containing protein n=1 Tax=Megalops atlanticus TaxID=7932 RepID=A0A9D3Q742_MEGAT|nr:hypothetical protein MATL_G00062170 [Megalops atlanticus]